jgi:hypothetical protein
MAVEKEFFHIVKMKTYCLYIKENRDFLKVLAKPYKPGYKTEDQ